MSTTSSLFLKTLRDAGITHAFVNWGSDHPALLEDIERQRVENGQPEPQIITCPNEMVALSAAHGYALVARRPAAVLVHVDVGTQSLAGAVHNADRGRVPVLIYAGAAPFSAQGELKGSRNEFIFWLQDIPDQPSIVRQYMRFTSEINSSRNVDKITLRALQFANANPQGPVYLWGRREIMEEDLVQRSLDEVLPIQRWSAPRPSTIPHTAAEEIAKSLYDAKHPVIVTSYLGRDPSAVALLVSLSDNLAIPVCTSCPSALCFPHDHPHFAGVNYGKGENKWIREADVVLVLDCDIPWIPTLNKPPPNAKIYHIDCDVLKQGIGTFYLEATASWQASCSLALQSILKEVNQLLASRTPSLVENRRLELRTQHANNEAKLTGLESALPDDGSFTVSNLLGVLRKLLPERTLMMSEAISNYPLTWEHLKPNRTESFFTSGASSLGWGLGACIGACIASRTLQRAENARDHELICLIVGDGSYLFGVPGSAFWMARRYKTPFLTIVLNNGGWKSPRLSMLGVYPSGLGSKASGQQLNVSFLPEAPDYGGIATAAGSAWSKKISRASDLGVIIAKAIEVVTNENRCAVVDCEIEKI